MRHAIDARNYALDIQTVDAMCLARIDDHVKSSRWGRRMRDLYTCFLDHVLDACRSYKGHELESFKNAGQWKSLMSSL
jgi:hypothetical protein